MATNKDALYAADEAKRKAKRRTSYENTILAAPSSGKETLG